MGFGPEHSSVFSRSYWNRLAEHDQASARQTRRARIRLRYVAVDDNSLLVFRARPGRREGATCAAFLLATAAFFAGHGVTIRRVMIDNALNYRRSNNFRADPENVALLNRARDLIGKCPRPSDIPFVVRASGFSAYSGPGALTCRLSSEVDYLSK